MSFVGKKSSQNEIKMKERPDENLKILINDNCCSNSACCDCFGVELPRCVDY